MTRRRLTFTTFVVMLILAACGDSGSSFARGEAASAPAADTAFFESEEPLEEPGFAANSGAADDLAQATGQARLIIRTGQLSIVVQDTEQTMNRVAQLAEDSGGWVVNSNIYQYSGDARTGDITVRIPAEGFASAVDAIKAMALEVTSESTSGQDVTDEYVDLSSRLGNLEATAARVRNFLDEAKDVEEALAVNMELSRLEGEIEVIKGRMQYLEQSSSFSTLTVNITPDILSQPLEVGGWRPEGVAREAVTALLDTLEGLATFLIYFAIWMLPLLLIVGVPIWLFVRFVVRRRRRRRAAAVAEVESDFEQSDDTS